MIPLPKLSQAIASLMSHRQLWKICAEASRDPSIPDIKPSREVGVPVLRMNLKNGDKNEKEDDESNKKQLPTSTKRRGQICFNCGNPSHKAADCYRASAVCTPVRSVDFWLHIKMLPSKKIEHHYK